ncbi:acyl carrier protein [Streptomyces rimosus]|uniref:acyl carrier protein n=1 Tax=Streptomyces rimosus TaxID=1927 RepID=UPI000A800B7A|nr:acyl carrier protein [Streptomyces rimosus]
MRECAGEAEEVALGATAADRTFPELGYDSLALLETLSRVERELGVALPDEMLSGAETPRQFVELVSQLVSRRATGDEPVAAQAS